MKKLILVMVAVFGVVAFAQPASLGTCGSTVKNQKARDGTGNQWVCDGTSWLPYKSPAVTVPSGSGQLKALTGTIDYDFPPIGAANDNAGCRDSFGFAVANAKVGDACFVGYLAPTPYDGGVTGQDFQASCSIVTTGIGVIRGCCMRGDGGSCNVDDAGYNCTCLQVK